MAQLIDKDKVVAEIERIKKGECPTDTYEGRCKLFWFEQFLSFLDTLEVKEVDLGRELETLDILLYDLDGVAIKGATSYLTVEDVKDIAKHFFELGLKANQENNVMGILEREVKIDAGGYPYINCDIEFYDYDKDIPLAKEGDNVKVILVKGE